MCTRRVFEELVEDYGLDGRVIVMNDSGNVLVGDANLLPTKMEWNSEGCEAVSEKEYAGLR